jgi:hypothetical protein
VAGAVMSNIPDFTETERWSIQSTVDERLGEGKVELHPADIEIQLSPDTPPSECPALFWCVDQCSIVVLKMGENRFHSRFFYQDLEQFGTGIEEFDNVADATVTPLRMQADYESVRSGAFPNGGAPS